MNSYLQLLQHYNRGATGVNGVQKVIAMLTAYPSGESGLFSAVTDLLPQVDAIHIYLNDFQYIPGFLHHEKIYLTRSGDFGYPLGECGKYYWCSELGGYHLIVSCNQKYPENYVKEIIREIEQNQRRCVITFRGYRVNEPYRSWTESVERVQLSVPGEPEIAVRIPEEGCFGYHSSTLKISRHHFYQPQFCHLWFAVQCFNQNIPVICALPPSGWQFSSRHNHDNSDLPQFHLFRDFLIKSCLSDRNITGEKFIPGTPNEMFNRIYVMNLDRRPDRLAMFSERAGRLGMETVRFSATDGNKEEVRTKWMDYISSPLVRLPEGIAPLENFTDKFTRYDHYIARIHFMEMKLNRKAVQSPGAFGYAATYSRILEEAVENDFDRILIFDDDVIFHKDFNNLFNKCMAQLPANWKLVMAGAMQHHWEPWIHWYSENLYQCQGSSVASHAVGIDRNLFLPLLFYVQRFDLPVDEGAIFHVQNVYSPDCFIFYPNIAIQDMTESDISSSAMNAGESEKWMKLFRWNPAHYDYPCNDPHNEKQELKFSSTKEITDE